MKLKMWVSGLLMFSMFVPSARAQSVFNSTLDDQQSVSVTVYNNGQGLVREQRKIQLPAGTGELRFMDVASAINPVTVSVKSLLSADSFFISEQNYEYDLISDSKLLDKYVGKQLKIEQWNEYQDRKELTEATLIANNGTPIYKIFDQIYLGHPGTVIVPEIPGNLIEKPTLTWEFENRSEAPQELEVTYLTGGLRWKADYVVTLDEKDEALDLSSWVTLDNTSGTGYVNAGLKLVAGDVNRVMEAPMAKFANARAEMVMMSDARAPQFQEQAFFEYHIYDLQRKTTLKNNQTKQINLIEAFGVKAEKEYRVQGNGYYWTQPLRGEASKEAVEVYVNFKNSESNKLGMPLPAGIMRFYKKDASGAAQFVGEDRIQHTPKNEEVRMKLGKAFDITAERIQTDFRQLTNNLYETEWEITLKNHKKDPVTVKVFEPINGNWKILTASHTETKVDAFTVRFDVTIPVDGEVKLKYRVQVGI